MPEEVIKHRENTVKGIENFHLAIAVAQRGFKYKNMFSQIVSSAKWSIFYKIHKDKVWDHGTFLMSVLDGDAIVRVLKLIQSNYIEKKVGYDKGLPKIDVHEIITIPFSKDDIMTLKNMEDPDIPKMIQEDLDLPFQKAKEKIDKSECVQVRVLSSKDWKRVDWKKSKLIDEKAECVHVP